MANMSLHTVTLVSWNKSIMTAVITIDQDTTQYSVVVPSYDPNFSANPPNTTDAIAWIKNWASKQIDTQATLPDLSTYVGSAI